MAYSDLTEEQQEYYELELLLTEEIFKQEKEKIESIKNTEEDTKNEILLLLLFLLKDKNNKDKLNLTEKEIKKYKSSIDKNINSILKNEIDNELIQIESILKDTIIDGYNTLNYIELLGNVNFKPSEINNEYINKILNEIIDNKTFKDRIIDNKNKIFNIIKEEIFSFLGGILTVEQIKRLIDNDIKTNKFNTDRLVNNEISRVLNVSKNKFRNDNNINKVIYCSVLEPTTCEHCMQLNGTIYNVNDKNKPDIPNDTHIYCKCFYISIPSENWIRNNNTADVSYYDYLRWKSENAVGGDK